jgi:uncharacterized protein (TIGR00255 family)
MRSMTGFGCGEAELEGSKLTCELRALNHRFLDVRVRMPDELLSYGFFVEQMARERLSRGRFDIGVRLEDSATALRFSTVRARAVYESLLQLRDELAPGTEVPVSALAALPELLVNTGRHDTRGTEQALGRAFAGALSSLDQMRQREGTALARELSQRLASLRALCAKAKEQSVGAAERQLGRLRERVSRLLVETPSSGVDPARLETELALMADRSDVTEEIVRLTSHFDQFEALLSSLEPVGRRLEFLLQEMAREANTLGSKSQDVKLSHLVVDMKSQLEKIREQVQNVE